MGKMSIQVPSICLPAAWATLVDVENINNLVIHPGSDLVLTGLVTLNPSGFPPFRYLQEKMVSINAIEVGAAAGALWAWIELAPYDTATQVALGLNLWAAIGGGGGPLPPVAPLIEAPLGVPGTIHNLMLPWAVHSDYARVVVQMPICAAPALNGWTVQAIFSGKGV